MIFSRAFMLWIEDVSICLIMFASSSIKWFSSLLFLMRDHFFVGIHSSNIEVLTVIGHGQMLTSNQDKYGGYRILLRTDKERQDLGLNWSFDCC